MTSSIDMAPLGLVVAMDRNRCIGRAGALPWHVPEDMKHFRELTTGHSVLMGRRTHESIGKALPKRRNIVISRQPGVTFEGCEVVGSFGEALERGRETDEMPIVIGGATVYEAALPQVTRAFVTELELEVQGDTFFPPLVPGEWREVERREGESRGVTFVTLERVALARESAPPRLP